MTDSFGARLRDERERRRISLASIAATTKIRASLFADLEADNVSRWPSGIFRRSFVRAYAEAVGLDADAVSREFAARFPDPADPSPAAAAAQAVPAAVAPPAPDAADTGLRLTFADSPTPFASGRLLARLRPRCAAVAWDAGMLLSAGLLLFVILGQFWLPLGVTSLVYYLGSVLVLGNTPGVSLFAPRPRDDAGAEPIGEEGGSLRVARIRQREPRPRPVERPANALRAVRRRVTRA